MKKISLFLLFLVTQIPARIFFVGSNPYLSQIAFPQDILQFAGEAVYMWPIYQQLPWWGDLDQPTRKPNDSYTTTEESISHADGRNFRQDASIHSFTNRKGITLHLKNNIVNSTLFETNFTSMVNTSSGRLRTDPSNSLPYDYRLSHTLGKFYLQPIFAFTLNGTPVGIKVGVGFTNTLHLKSTLKYTINGVEHESDAIGWGWSRLHCASFFDMTEVAGDAFVQDEYARGPVWQLDFQGGTTLPKAKIGVRYRTVLSAQDQYSYYRDTSVNGPGSKLGGWWQKSQWQKKTTENIVRLYGNYNWFANDRVKYNTLLFLGYAGNRARNALSSNADVESDWRDLVNNAVVEINPNININFGMPMFYLDAALLIEYSYTRFSNRYNRWVNGGNIDSYRQTSTGGRDEYENESFSYANDNFFDIGFDMNVCLPVYRDSKRAASLSLILFVNNKFTRLTKFYGNYPTNSTDFNIIATRPVQKRETWFNSMWQITVRQSPWTVQIDLGQPLLYKLVWNAKVIEKASDKMLWSQMKEMPFAAQQGVTAGFMVSRDIHLNRINK